MSAGHGRGREGAFRAARRDWEDVGSFDPLWGVLSTKAGRYNHWDVDAFMRTGEEEIGALMETVAELGRPARRGRALDFGCGVGRLTRALAGRFDEVVGVDAAAPMVEWARELSADVPACEFVTNPVTDLRCFDGASFDLIYTRVVLQHLPTRELIKGYIAELARVCRGDGLLVFQLLTYIPPVRRLRLRHRAYRALRRLGAPPRLLHERLRLMPFQVTQVPEVEVEAVLAAAGARTIRVEREHIAHRGSDSATFFVARA